MHCYIRKYVLFLFGLGLAVFFVLTIKTFFDLIGSSLQGVYGEREGVGEREETVEARSKKRGVSSIIDFLNF